jgi:hypothetical protein
MGEPMNRGMMIARVWNMLNDEGAMRSIDIYTKYCDTYLKYGVYTASAFSQILRRSGCFIPVGEETVTVWDSKPIEALIKPYITEGCHPLRKLSKMPAFVREAVKNWREQNGA